MQAIDAAAVLDFWFLPRTDPAHGLPRDAWFRKDEAFDATIRTRFAALLEAARTRTLLPDGPDALDAPGASGGRDPASPERGGVDAVRADLARVLVCDQFSRNAWRDRGQAFALDAQALVHAGALLANDRHLQLSLLERWFAYMPFEHAEDRALQALSVALFERLHADTLGAGAPRAIVDAVFGALDYAKRHRDVVERFGRFPHRNALLGREDTDDERVFLAGPGPRF